MTAHSVWVSPPTPPEQKIPEPAMGTPGALRLIHTASLLHPRTAWMLLLVAVSGVVIAIVWDWSAKPLEGRVGFRQPCIRLAAAEISLSIRRRSLNGLVGQVQGQTILMQIDLSLGFQTIGSRQS